VRARSRSLVGVLALAVLAVGERAVADDSAIGDLVREVGATRWSARYAEWRATRSEISCVPFRSWSSSLTLAEEWSYRCERRRGAQRAEWFFYVLDVGGSAAPRLEQFRARLEPTSNADLDRTFAELLARMSQSYGDGERITHLDEPGSAFWRDIIRWRRNDVEIVIYRNAETSETKTPPTIDLLARHRPLVERMTGEGFALEQLEFVERLETGLGDALSRALGADRADVRALLADVQQIANGGPPPARARTVTAISALVDEALRGPIDRRPLLLLAADRLAASVQVNVERAPDWDAERATLAARGVAYQWSPLGATWVYRRELLLRVWREFPESAWGEWAFALLLHRGWDTTIACGDGSDQFRAVIREGERFLAQRRASPQRLTVLYAVALAYETWWSLSHGGDHDDYADPARYRDGADVARQSAIRRYEEILRAPTAGIPAQHARRVLGRLRLQLATNERSFFCVYD
jgi:hypothetical protein